jgi:hypothetical protein
METIFKIIPYEITIVKKNSFFAIRAVFSLFSAVIFVKVIASKVFFTPVIDDDLKIWRDLCLNY